MKNLRGLLADLSASWLKRRKAQPPATVKPIRTAPHVAHQTTRQLPAHKPKPVAARDITSHM
ncbi:hypothetical protein [Mesorhizobium erdmanii]|uniref:hypothetical protein n=1 Tax=Mesorhizobium erdmanii TaxID=1777866 RepID=UPI000B2EC1E8|nr:MULTISPECIES: hypothetical protein [Mesorhizobium]